MNPKTPGTMAREYLECRKRIFTHTDMLFALGHLLETAGSVVDRESILNANAVQTIGKSIAEHSMAIESELDEFLAIPEAENQKEGSPIND